MPPDDTPISIEVRQRCIALAALKDRIEVTNSVQYEFALQEQITIREQMDAIETSYEDKIRPTRKILDGWYEDKRLLLKPLQEADKAIGTVALAWKAAEDEAAERERQRLQREADEQAERERQDKLKAIEKEKARAAKAGDRDTVRELAQEAKAVAAQPLQSRQVQVESRVPDVAGMATGDNWKINEQTVNIKALCEAVYKGWCSVNAVVPNAKYLNQRAKAECAAFNTVDPKTKRSMFPGVVAVNVGVSRRT